MIRFRLIKCSTSARHFLKRSQLKRSKMGKQITKRMFKQSFKALLKIILKKTRMIKIRTSLKEAKKMMIQIRMMEKMIKTRTRTRKKKTTPTKVSTKQPDQSSR